MQDTWIKAVEKLDTFRWESAFGTWLHAIALNVVPRGGAAARAGARRWSCRSRRSPPRRRRSSGLEPMDLERAIAALPDGYRTVLVLHDVEGYTHEEIAEQLGVTPGTTKSQLFWARRAVRAQLVPAKVDDMNDSDDLTPSERRAFEALPRERAPRAELEDRVVAALQRRGLLPIPLAVRTAAAPRHALAGGRGRGVARPVRGRVRGRPVLRRAERRGRRPLGRAGVRAAPRPRSRRTPSAPARCTWRRWSR